MLCSIAIAGSTSSAAASIGHPDAARSLEHSPGASQCRRLRPSSGFRSDGDGRRSRGPVSRHRERPPIDTLIRTTAQRDRPRGATATGHGGGSSTWAAAIEATLRNFWRFSGGPCPEIWLARAKSDASAVGLRNRRSEVRILSGALGFRLAAGIPVIFLNRRNGVNSQSALTPKGRPRKPERPRTSSSRRAFATQTARDSDFLATTLRPIPHDLAC